VTIPAPPAALRSITTTPASLVTSGNHSPSAVTEFAAEPFFVLLSGLSWGMKIRGF